MFYRVEQGSRGLDHTPTTEEDSSDESMGIGDIPRIGMRLAYASSSLLELDTKSFPVFTFWTDPGSYRDRDFKESELLRGEKTRTEFSLTNALNCFI